MSGAELLIAHVYRPPNLSLAEAVAPGVYDEWDFNLRTEVARRLDPFVESARRQLVAARALVLSGVPRKAILAAATETRTDLIVIGSRERHGLGRLFRRSLSSRIASSARCRVMTVRANPAGQRLPPFDHRN